jgi:hypothetical protein
MILQALSAMLGCCKWRRVWTLCAPSSASSKELSRDARAPMQRARLMPAVPLKTSAYRFEDRAAGECRARASACWSGIAAVPPAGIMRPTIPCGSSQSASIVLQFGKNFCGTFSSAALMREVVPGVAY